MRVLVSAGEASGDLYASRVVEVLKTRHPDWEFFGCAGPRMQAAGVRTIVDQRSLAVVGIVEVLGHLPRIWGEFRKLVRAAEAEKPDLAILTDSPDFHLRLAKKLKRLGIPVVYLIAPQAWAWRTGRVKTMRATLQRLLCIFPFEEAFFAQHGVPATYIGHPLARMVRPTLSRAELCSRLGIAEDARIVAVLPGSRLGEAARHLPTVTAAVEQIRKHHAVTPVFAFPKGFGEHPQQGASQPSGTAGREPAAAHNKSFTEPIWVPYIQRIGARVIQGHTWDVLAHAELALAASGTVTIEAALLGAPMVTFYRVNALSWYLGRWLVKSPFLSMVNLVAERQVVAELIQQDMTAASVAGEALRLLEDPAARERMRVDLAEVALKLASERDPMELAADWVERVAGAEQASTAI